MRVTWRDARGGRHDAAVDLVTAAELEKLPSADPFGWWIAFVPHAAEHRPIEVTAYGADGGRLGSSFTLRRP